jgi:hypothetical protein
LKSPCFNFGAIHNPNSEFEFQNLYLMHHVLIICYDFPGIYAAGVIRTYQWAKSLRDFGWHPIILSAQLCGGRGDDNIEVSDGELTCPKFTARPSRFLVPFQVNHRLASKPPERDGLTDSGFKRLVRYASQMAVPDGKVGWLYPAVRRGLRIAGEYPIALCFSVSPRPTAHLVAQRLARRLNIPWVADFALPWSDAYWLERRPFLVRFLDQQLEKITVRSAEHITVAYTDIARSLVKRHGCSCENKITVIPTGFDEDLFTDQISSSRHRFTVVYPGNHFCEEGRQGESFLQAIDEWLNGDPSLKKKVEFVFIGKRDEDLLRRRAVMVHPENIRVESLISHRGCIQAIRSSHACVVNTVGNRIPAKVYECMRAGKWILALSEPGTDLFKMIQDYSKAVVVPPRDVSAVIRSLDKIMHWTGAEPDAMGESERMAKYSSKHSAAVLAGVFERLSQPSVAKQDV